MAVAFDTYGAGPAFVLLHGTGGQRGMWDPVVGTLARERRVIALDLPGFAASADEDFDATPNGYTLWLERWFAEQGLGRPHVAGNSMGGGIALELARRGAVASATALSPVGFWTARELAFAQQSLRAARAIVKVTRPAIPAVTRSAAGALRSSPRSTPSPGACRPTTPWPPSTPSSTGRRSSPRWPASPTIASATATSCAACR
jgi:pimeloyl-ACP methyl ester carboxylesterase